VGRKKYQLDIALRFWGLTHVAKKIGGVTPFRQIFGLIVSEKALKASFIPVDEDIEIPPGVVAPGQIVRDYITRASHRTIVHECPCRSGEGCENAPRDLGCMILGDGALEVDPSVGYQATVEQGLAHLDRALEAGLLPMIGHLRVDKVVFGVRRFERMLTLCFCCRCCCITRSGMRNLVSAYPDALVRLEGVRVAVTGDCAGCGECVPGCPVQNVSIVDGVARIGEMCLGCGTCVATCTSGSIEMTIEPGSSMVEDLRRRVEAGVDIE